MVVRVKTAKRAVAMLPILRQWRYPRAFRIYPADWTKALQGAKSPSPATEIAAPPADAVGSGDVSNAISIASRTVTELGTGLWRLRQRMIDPQSGEPLPEFRRSFRHLASVWDALEESGVDVIDHSGQPYDPGQALVVLAFQPTPDILTEVVLETIRPSIYMKDKRLQVGEVIVGTPVNE